MGEHTDRARAMADELADIADERTPIHLHVGDTGRFPAAEATTKPDNQVPASNPPQKVANAFETVLRAVDTWPKVFGLLILCSTVIALAWRGVLLFGK